MLQKKKKQLAQKGKTWFPELADKRKLSGLWINSVYGMQQNFVNVGGSTKVHLYYCMIKLIMQ